MQFLEEGYGFGYFLLDIEFILFEQFVIGCRCDEANSGSLSVFQDAIGIHETWEVAGKSMRVANTTLCWIPLLIHDF